MLISASALSDCLAVLNDASVKIAAKPILAKPVPRKIRRIGDLLAVRLHAAIPSAATVR